MLYAALISIGGLVAVYAYLPFAASRSPVINWGNPRSLQEIWWHVTGRQYRVFLSFSPSMMGTQFVEFCRMLLREFGPAWLPLSLVLAFAGLRSAFRQDRTSFWFLFFIVMADLAYALSYEIAEDKDAYYLPTFISVAIAAGFGIRWLIQLSASKAMALQKTYWIAGSCCCPHICNSVRGELAVQQSQALLYRARLCRKSVQHDRAKWAVTYTRLAGRRPNVL